MMKQRQSREKACLVFMLLLGIQILFMLSTRISSPNSQVSGKESLWCKDTLSISQALIQSIHGGPIICDRSHENYEWCFLNRPTIMDPSSITFHTMGLQSSSGKPLLEKIRPYPRKREKFTMSLVNEVRLTTSSVNKSCDVYHEAPALVFSVSGYTGNFFHDFNDGLIPLYITVNTLFPNQDVTLVVTNFTNWWYSKYEVLLRQVTRHRVINLDNQTATHCFPSAAVGLISHGPMTVDSTSLPGGQKKLSFLDFRAFVESAYRKCPPTQPLPPLKPGKPRLVLLSRAGKVGRVMLNQNHIIKAAKQLGFDVVIFKPTRYTYICDAYWLINDSHALIGVHGAALTHSLFLRPGSVLIQVVPLGNEWLADSYFKKAAQGLGLEYVEYKITAKESSLAEKYGLDDVVVRDPRAIIRGNWSALDRIYLKGQDVRLDIKRFKYYSLGAYLKAKRFMDNNG